MTARLVSQRLAARTTRRQVEASLLADRAAALVDAALMRHWRAVSRSLRTPLIIRGQEAARRGLSSLQTVARDTLGTALVRLARWGHRESVRALRLSLPRPYLRAAAASRLGLTEGADYEITEDRNLRLLEAWPVMPGVERHHGPRSRPGELEMALRALGLPSEPFGALGAVLEPAVRPLSAEGERQAFLDLLFPPPSLEAVQRVLYARVGGLTWEDRLARAADPIRMGRAASVVGQGIAAGKTHGEIAAELVPVVDGVRSAARRIARTESMRVVHGVQMASWQGLGDLIEGYTLIAVLDHATRPAHAARNGTTYYVNPKPGQRGLDEMPYPPLEPDGTVAWNCRCTLSVRIRQPDTVPAGGFTTAEEKLVPDGLSYQDWYARADPRRQRMVVGPRRWAAAGADAGDWSTFIDAESGELLSLDALRSETPEARAARVAAVRGLMAERREALRRVYLGAGA